MSSLLRCLIVMGTLLIISSVPPPLALAQAEPPANRAAVVVQYQDGSIVEACVSFAEPSLNGVELLMRAEVPIVVQDGGMGSAVCKIGPDGCDYPNESCFCTREAGRDIYWAFYLREAGSWRYSPLGASSMRAEDGDLHGWAWGLGESGRGAEPPAREFAAICGEPASVPLPAISATEPPIATPTGTPPLQPTANPTPFANTPPPPEASGSSPVGLGLIALVLGTIGAAIWWRRQREGA